MREIDEKTLNEAKEKISCKLDLSGAAASAGSSCGIDAGSHNEKKPVRLTEMTTAGG